MTTGQKVLFEHQGINYSFTVSHVTVEGQERSSDRGMISDDTFIAFEASRDSGIKVSFRIFFWYLHYPSVLY
jgi:vesicle-fusing ATPase